VVGETIGSYRILSQLGAGAMGQVYLAEHLRLRRKAALKLLARELVDKPELLERFFLEARATSAIAHPGIVQVFDCDVDPTGRPYIVMEYLEGETLAAVLARRGALPPVTAARLAHGVAQALEAAHEKGIVHRDLKPENMFVRSEPPESIKLVDFGIAKLAGDFQAGQVHRTRAGALMGTPVYMSPEQCRDSANIDARTDVYSLGCVTYEMLCGRPPLNRDNLGDLVVAHLTEAPRDVRELNAGVPIALAALTQDLLRKDPNERPQNMRAVAERLSAIIGSLTTVAGQAGSIQAAQPIAAAALLATSLPAPPPAGGAPSSAPPPSVSAGAASPAATTTTFGSAASERLAGERPSVAETASGAPAGPASRRGSLVVAVVVAAAGIAVFAGALVIPGARSRPRASRPGVAVTAGAPPTSAAPAPARAAVAEPGSTPTPAPAGSPVTAAGTNKPASSPSPSHSQNRASRRGAEIAAASERFAKAPSSESPIPAGSALAAGPGEAAPRESAGDLFGRWEGPWADPGNRQKGRLFLDLGGGGAVSGWMYNEAAKLSFRMLGRIAPRGELTLACQCPPGQAFSAAGALRAAGGELKGVLTLTSGARAFGQSHVSLRRTNAIR